MKMKIIALLIIVVGHLSAIIINIPTDQPTIQAGIDVAVDADTVLVQPGTYIENINYNGKAITVGSLFFTTQDTTYISQTIIDGNNIGSVVSFTNNENSNAVLSGLKIQNGSSLYGGGININSSSPTISNCIIENNTSTGDGNVYGGGGIAINSNSNPSISSCIIKGNYAADFGGGIKIRDYSNPNVTNCLIINNSVGDATYHRGGGISIRRYSDPTITNCTISNNIALVDCGGGVSMSGYNGSVSPIFKNTIIWENSVDNIAIGPSVTFNITYSDIEDGTGESWFGKGCINEDPLFANPGNNNYHLQSTSPCIDAGDPASPLDPDGTTADMGAYYSPHLKPNFSADPIFGYNNLSVNFTDASESYVSHWFWDFESDGIFDDFTQNPSHIYNQPGIYDVTLKIEYDSLALVDSLVKSNYVVIQESQLQPPQNPLITISGDDIILNWDSVVNANYYLIYLETDPYGCFEFLDYTTGITTYTHSGVTTTNNMMFYVIIGFDGDMGELKRFINGNRIKKFDKVIKRF